MVPEFEAAAFSLNTNHNQRRRDTTDYGFHIIKLLDKMPAQNVPIAKVADKIKEYLDAAKNQRTGSGLSRRLEQGGGCGNPRP